MAASKPTSSLSLTVDALLPLTLNQYFGTLTAVRVVPLSEVKFTPRLPVSWLLRRQIVRSWAGDRTLSGPKSPIRSSTILTVSAKA